MADPLPPVAARGRLVIADRVIERIATIAASEIAAVVDQASGLRRLPGRGLPRAEATLAGGRARIAVQIAAPWPTPLAQVAAQTRDRVKDRVTTLVGTDVVAVDVTVADVVTVQTERRRRVS